jgi:hypothetical protein
VSGRTHLGSSSHPVKLTFSPQGSACAGIEPGTSRTRVLCALAHSMNMHGRAAAMVTPIGGKKTLFRADSVVSSSGCAARGRVKSSCSRKNKWKHARLQGAQRREGVCVGLGCRGAGATLWTSFDVHLAISAPLGMGRRPKHIYTLTLRCTSRGHLELSLGLL